MGVSHLVYGAKASLGAPNERERERERERDQGEEIANLYLCKNIILFNAYTLYKGEI
ncbi:Hypothetical predicted protein [Olea europaea subsp. europaea]|uniref:Uncharacterized protein n=1 Tax=Olea europaea subsp. europaea TaxID=158383 RepID=A0A8S0QHQ8_OLEEU|nr:Hypothetical predicted protein [Olea europaea subsp. europaea]